MIRIQTLASGSRGNSVYISSGSTHILVDVGLSLPQLVKRAASAGVDLSKIQAVFITHEHCDHIGGLEPFLGRFSAVLYIHPDTAEHFTHIDSERIKYFGEKTTQIGDVTVNYFPVPHDSSFCFGYTFSCGRAKISMATDLGRVSDDILAYMHGSQIVLLECNHDLLKLSHNTKYPMMLKRRIMGSQGHLSNPSCALAVYRLAQMGVNQIILAHLSEQNNSPSLAYNFVKDFLQARGVIEGRDIWIDIATQDRPGLPFTIDF